MGAGGLLVGMGGQTGRVVGEEAGPPAQEQAATPSGVGWFRDPEGRFSLVLPEGWAPPQKLKRGADAYFVDAESKYNNLGVTASRVRIDGVEAFGTLEAAGMKLLAAERAKDSVLSAELLSQVSRQGASGTLFYDFTYTVVTSYGPKQVQCSVGVADHTLFIANGQVFCKEGGCEEVKVAALHGALQTFDVGVS